MNKTTKSYGNWNKSYGFSLENGKLYSFCGRGIPIQFQEYRGKGTPFACQAQRQALLLGTFDMEACCLKEDDILFGIKGINNSYDTWKGDIFKDYEIEILQGKQEDIYKFFEEDSEHQCVISCDECCGCGDW